MISAWQACLDGRDQFEGLYGINLREGLLQDPPEAIDHGIGPTEPVVQWTIRRPCHDSRDQVVWACRGTEHNRCIGHPPCDTPPAFPVPVYSWRTTDKQANSTGIIATPRLRHPCFGTVAPISPLQIAGGSQGSFGRGGGRSVGQANKQGQRTDCGAVLQCFVDVDLLHLMSINERCLWVTRDRTNETKKKTK